jgi:hypothetical protein
MWKYFDNFPSKKNIVIKSYDPFGTLRPGQKDNFHLNSTLKLAKPENGSSQNNTLESLNQPPVVPPRRKHSGKNLLKQAQSSQLNASSSSTVSTITDTSSATLSLVSQQQFNGLPLTPKVKV